MAIASRRVENGPHAAVTIVRCFVPELRRHLRTNLENLWRRRPAFHALALGLHALIDSAPFAAAALIPGEGHAIPSVRDALRTATVL